MQIVTLGARLPLTKTFVLHAGALHASPYPHVARVTSYHHDVADLPALAALLREEGRHGRCLFNGQLTAPLSDESRAGKTAKADRHWLVFDFDKVEGTDHKDVVARYLPAYCQDVSYVSQLSASMFRPDVKTWSGHIFMLLKTPVLEQRLKQWFEHLNFTQPALEQSLRLSDSQQALHWPLDRTVAYDSKLIYIAPPKCVGFTPAVKQHIEFVKKRTASLVIPTFTPVDSITIRQKINALRRDIGLDEITYDTAVFGDYEVLRESDFVEIHGIRTSGDHYIRFNLNGGDSYAYYIDLRNPDLIRNFKGEPFLKTADAAPELHKSLKKVAPRAVQKQALDDGTEVLAFYATNQSSRVKVGTYSPISNNIVLNNSTETAARAWLAEYGLVQKAFLPHMDIVFDPSSDVACVPGMTQLNMFKTSVYMRQVASSATPSGLNDLPPVIGKWVRSMLGSPTDKILAHFINWLAFIFQRREQTGTAWVLSGVEGTGKGSFAKYVLRPLFVSEQVRILNFNALMKDFNGFMEQSMIIVFDETDMRAVENSEELMMKIQHYVTDSPIEIRRMGTDWYSAQNYSNFLFYSNEMTPIRIKAGQRRFNVAERQLQKLVHTPNELVTLTTGAELPAFADMLIRWPVNEQQVRQLIDTEAAHDIHEATSTINQLVAEAIINGNLQFFLDRMPSDAIAAADFHNRFNPVGMFKTQIDQFIAAADNETPVYLKDDELFPLFRTLIPDTRYFQDSKTWRLRHYVSLGLDYRKKHRVPGNKFAYGVRVVWQRPENVPTACVIPENVTPIAKGKKR